MKNHKKSHSAEGADAQTTEPQLMLFDELDETRPAISAQAHSPRPKRRRSWVDHLLNLLIVALIVAGAALLLREPFVRWRRQQLAQELQAAVDANSTQQVAYDPRANRLGQAEYDFYEVVADGRIVGASAPANAEATTLSAGLQYMTPIGRIEIPLLKINVPLIKELDYYAMYYAACHWDKSVLPLEPGNSAIFLHRDSFEDYDFTHADRLQKNDPIFITYNGIRHRYSIVNISTIDPSETMERLLNTYQSDQSSYVTLVTCTPPKVFSHRLLITAILDDAKTDESSKPSFTQAARQ